MSPLIQEPFSNNCPSVYEIIDEVTTKNFDSPLTGIYTPFQTVFSWNSLGAWKIWGESKGPLQNIIKMLLSIAQILDRKALLVFIFCSIINVLFDNSETNIKCYVDEIGFFIHFDTQCFKYIFIFVLIFHGVCSLNGKSGKRSNSRILHLGLILQQRNLVLLGYF